MMQDDANVTLRAAMNWVQEFCTERDWDQFHTPKDLAIGLVTESSELLELFRFVRESEADAMLRDPNERSKIADELADSLYFILRFAQLYEFDLARALREKLLKNAQKYPIGKK